MDIIENFIISVPIDENFNIINTINNLQENIIQIINFNNIQDENVHINIEFEYYNSEPPEYNNYFKNCNEINNNLCKPIKIKKCDIILQETCFICMENYLCNEYKRELPSCKHYFHKKCIDKWLKTKASCPVCRDELLK
jgi:hypothetical protein